MPVQTELERAKEVCKQQGYYVIQQGRVRELYTRHMVPDYEWDRIKGDAAFKSHVWRQMMHKIAMKIAEDDTCVLRSERDIQEDPRGRFLLAGHIFQSRITVISYG